MKTLRGTACPPIVLGAIIARKVVRLLLKHPELLTPQPSPALGAGEGAQRADEGPPQKSQPI